MRSVLAAVAVLLLSGCAQPAPSVIVAATTYPVAFVVGWVGSGHAEVRALVPPGAEVEGWAPNPEAMAALDGARLLFYNGAGLEPWAAQLSRQAGIQGIDTAAGLDLVPLETGHGHAEGEAGHDHGHDAHAADLHHHEEGHLHDGELDARVWLDPHAMAAMGDNAARALAAADSGNAEHYARRAAELRQALDGLHDRYLRGLRQCASRHLAVARADYGALHGAFDVFQHPVPGLTADAASPAALAQAQELAQEFGLTRITFGRAPSANVTLALASVGLGVSVVHPLDSLGSADLQAGRNYFTVMNDNLAVLRASLRCA